MRRDTEREMAFDAGAEMACDGGEAWRGETYFNQSLLRGRSSSCTAEASVCQAGGAQRTGWGVGGGCWDPRLEISGRNVATGPHQRLPGLCFLPGMETACTGMALFSSLCFLFPICSNDKEL